MPGRSRRDFLKMAAAAAAAPTIARAANGKTVTLLHEASFIPTFDDYMRNTLAPAYERETGIKVVYQVTAIGSLPARIYTVVEKGLGADIAMTFLLYPFLFADKLMNLGDIAEAVGRQQGGWYSAAREAAVVGSEWKAIPLGNQGQLMNWRTDWFAEVGIKKFPDTWEELYEAGKKLKANGHPFGFQLGHGFGEDHGWLYPLLWSGYGDNHGWLYPLLWSYGGHEVEADGKTVVIDSDETARAVDFARKFFTDTMTDDVLRWTDTTNNNAWLAGQISCTNNAESILWRAKRDFPDIAKVTDQAQNPAGPKGRFHLLNCISHSVFDFSPQKKEAHEFLRWLMDKKQLDGWYASAETYYQPLLHAYDTAPMWRVELRNVPYRDALASAHLPGWPAPPDHRLAEVIAKYVVIDMFAQACAGRSTKDVIRNAAARLEQIYRRD